VNDDAILEIPGRWDIPYMYSIGKTASKFLGALARSQVLATHCPRCDQTYVPPRSFCEDCFIPLDDWRELGAGGSIEAATIVSEAFPGMPEPPYALAYVRLDGADTSLGNFVRGIDLSDLDSARSRLTIGSRVRVCFSAKPEGRITDFHYALE
jgi:uncharacterized protein